MKKITLLLALFSLFFLSGFGQILTFDFAGLVGNEASATSNSNDANLTAAIITRGAGLTAAANADRFNATNWALTSIDNAVTGNDYMEFSITPNSGFQFEISSIYIQLQRSATGPSAIALRNSLDGYAANLDQVYTIVDNTNTQTFTFTFAQANSSVAVTYRIYMYAEALAGSGGIGDGAGNDIIVNGTTSSTSGNEYPVIENILISQQNPVSFETESVSADITDTDGTIASAELHWGTETGSLTNTIPMSGVVNTYTTDSDIPAQASGTTVYFEIEAVDDLGGITTSTVQSYDVIDLNVTFRVDMAEQTVSGNGVHLAGTFAGLHTTWSPSAIEMTDPDIDFVYTVILLQRANTTIQFKYINGNTWDWPNPEDVPDACSYPTTDNRYLTTATTDSILDLVCFASCTSCTPAIYNITFQVNMENQTVSGAGVYLAGSFTNWQTDAILMSNFEGSVWSTSVSLDELSSQEYKFVNGDPLSGGSWEDGISGGCTNGSGNRTVIIPSFDETLPPVCFNSCSVCEPTLIISEVADPSDDFNARFVEIYNLGGSPVDFTDVTVYLSRQSNGGTTWGNLLLDGTVEWNGKYVVAFDETIFNTTYGFFADQISGIINGNGDDGYFLYLNGNNSSGTLMDAYGVVGEDGSGLAWEYLDTKAVRLRSVTAPNPTWTASEWDIPAVAGTLDMTPSVHNADVDWNGTTSADWNTKSNNWSGTNGYIPDASFNVTIPNGANQPVIANQAACNNLSINSGSSLDVGVTSFDIYGNLNVISGGTFTIGSNNTQNASVIVHGTATGNATVQRYFVGHTEGADNGWHNIGSPVNNMTVAGSDFEPGAMDDLYWWEESTDTWKNYKANAFDFTNGMGYLCAFEISGTKNFVGALNSGDFTMSGLTKGNWGFNLLGNPYASALIWNSADWTLTNVGANAQIWEEANANYAVIAPDGFIPSTNGFFVEVATAAGGSVIIPASARTHNATNNYKNTVASDNNQETLDLKVTNDANMYFDLCRIGFKADATEAWDMAYDAHKLFGGAATSQLWSVVNNENFVYNYLPYVYESYQVPVHFRAGVNATHHITVDGIDGFFENSEIYLEDLQTEEVINLTEQQMYSFTATTNDAEARFILHFFGVTSVDDPIAVAKDAHIYAVDQTVYIRFNELSTNNSQVEIFNTIGQQVYFEQLAPQSLSSIQLNEKPGIYIVRLKTENGLTTQKVIIK